MYIRRQLPKAVLYSVKSGKCPEHGKMRSPDMRWNKDSLRTNIQHNFQKIVTGKPQDRAAVRMNISNGFQLCRQSFCLLETWKNQKAVYFSHLSVLLINRADFSSNHKSGSVLLCSLFRIPYILRLQTVQTVFFQNQLLFQFLSPCRVGKISCPQHPDPFPSCLKIQILRRQIAAGCP